MNRSYIPEETKPFVSPLPPHAETPRVIEALLVFFDLVIGILSASAVRTTLRALGAMLCFFAFLFVIGAVEAGTLGFGAGVLSSVLLCAIAFFCVYRPKNKKGND